MRTLGAALSALALLLVAGCGEESGSFRPPPSAAQWHDCTADEFDDGGQVVARGNFDEHGGRDTVRLFGPGSGPCANGLVLRDGAGASGVDVSGMDLDPASVRAERLHGSGAALLVTTSRSVARGGVQPHLFVTGGQGGDLVEVVKDGRPLLPFVATDGGGQPTTATCEPDGQVALWTATPAQPPGIVLAWDVRKTTYRITGGKAEQVSSDLVEDATIDPTMRKKMPQLFQPDGFLTDC